MQIVVHNAAQVVVQMRKLTNGVVEIVNGTGTNARFQLVWMSITSMIILGITLVIVSSPAIRVLQMEVVYWKQDVLNPTAILQTTHLELQNTLIREQISAIIVECHVC